MPTFNISKEIEEQDGEVRNHDLEIDFEVFCGNCNAGLCMESTTRHSRNRRFPQVTVNLCPTCEKQLKDQISDLENEVSRLTTQIEALQEEKELA